MFPKADERALMEHLARAREIAGNDLQAEYAHRCLLNEIYPQRTRAMQQYMLIEPAKVFDNLYFLGHAASSNSQRPPADVLLANHQTQDGSLVKLEELRSRLPGTHPYVA